MRLENGGGDKLASGAPRASFGPPRVTQERWDSIFSDYNPETEYEVKKDETPSPFRRLKSRIR